MMEETLILAFRIRDKIYAVIEKDLLSFFHFVEDYDVIPSYTSLLSINIRERKLEFQYKGGLFLSFSADEPAWLRILTKKLIALFSRKKTPDPPKKNKTIPSKSKKYS